MFVSRSRRFVSALIFCVIAGVCISSRAETFKNPELIETGADPVAVATGDLNGDGITDIVYVDGNARFAAHVLLGNGDGTFTHKSDLPLPAALGWIINLADINNDGIVDIIMGGASSSVGEIAVFRGNGDGTFQGAVITNISHSGSNGGTASFNWKMAFGDVNGDGITDLVAADASSATIYVLLGDNSGAFTFNSALGPYYFTGQVRTYLFDVNGDGKLDIVVNDIIGAQTYVLLANGAATFQPATVYLSFARLFIDLNGDGHPDLVGMPALGQVQILEGKADGTFGSPTVIATIGSNDQLVSAADFNGDGVLDLLFLTPDGVGVALGQGNLSYGKVVSSVAGTANLAFLNDVATGDFDANKYADVAMGVDAGLLILRGNGDGSFVSGASYDIGSTVGSVAVADFNGDTLPDIAVTVAATYPRVLIGNGTGSFTLASDQNTTYLTTPPSLRMLSADFNGDSKRDLEIVESSSSYPYGQPFILFGVGNATFDLPTSINSDPVLIGDFNNDGRSDMIAMSNGSISVWLGQSNETFSQVLTTPNYPTYPVLAIGDINHDGKLDAITQESSLRVWLGNGNGTFTQGNLINNSSQSRNTELAVVADIDGDGNADLVTLPYPNSGGLLLPLTIYYGNGNGTFQAPISFWVSRAYTQLAVADINKDNKPDLIFSDGGGIAVMMGLGTRAFGPEQHLVAGQHITGLTAMDVNGDGFPDIVAANSTGTTVVVLLNQPSSNPATGAPSNGVLSFSANPVPYGQAVTLALALSVSSGTTPTGSVSFAIDGSFVGTASVTSGTANYTDHAVLNTGTHIVTATYNGDKTYASETFPASLTVAPPVYPTVTTLTASPTTVYTSQTVSLTATVTGNSAPAPSGIVRFLDGSATLGVQQLYGNSLLLIDTNLLSAGTHSLTAVFQGWQDPFNEQAVYQPSTSVPVIVTVLATPTNTSMTVSATSATAGTVITFTANVGSNSTTPFGGVTFYDGVTPLGTSSLLADGSCTFSTASLVTGTHSITATFNANATFAPSTSAISTITINSAAADLRPTAVAMVEAVQGNQSVLMAYVTAPVGAPTGRVAFLDGGAVLGAADTDSGGVASLAVPPLTSGSHSLFAAFVGGPQLAPSVSPALIAQIPGPKEAFALSLSAHSIGLTSQPVLITVSPGVEFRGDIQLNCASGVPRGYRCAFSPAALSSGVSQLRLEPTSRSSKLQARLSFIIPSAGLFSMVLFGTLRRKRKSLMLMLAVLGVVCLLSCGIPETPPKEKGITVLSIRATAGTGVNAAIQSAQLIVVSEAN
jgi:hypothetical protein